MQYQKMWLQNWSTYVTTNYPKILTIIFVVLHPQVWPRVTVTHKVRASSSSFLIPRFNLNIITRVTLLNKHCLRRCLHSLSIAREEPCTHTFPPPLLFFSSNASGFVGIVRTMPRARLKTVILLWCYGWKEDSLLKADFEACVPLLLSDLIWLNSINADFGIVSREWLGW